MSFQQYKVGQRSATIGGRTIAITRKGTPCTTDRSRGTTAWVRDRIARTAPGELVGNKEMLAQECAEALGPRAYYGSKNILLLALKDKLKGAYAVRIDSAGNMFRV